MEILTRQCSGSVDFFEAAVDIFLLYYWVEGINYSCKESFTSFVTNMSGAP